MKALKIYSVALLLMVVMFNTACQTSTDETSHIPTGKFWVDQGINHILEPWTKNAIDTSHGTFHTFLDRQWKPYNQKEKYPGMLSRHVFSYSAGYLLTGNKKYLDKATELVDYIIRHGWDKKYGGWYNTLNQQGNVIDSSKDGFYQAYAVTGLAMYYLVTHDKQVLNYVERSHEILSNEAWDDKYGGYYRELNRDLSVAKDNKSFSPQLAPVSGYLVYLYLATREDAYLQQMKKVMDLALNKMRKTGSPWVLERFDKEWNYTYSPKGDSTELNTGHNAEIIWMLLRLAEMNRDDTYRQQALHMAKVLYQFGFDEDSGIWYHRTGLEEPSVHSNSTPWWIQAYGNMLSLYLYHQTSKETYLKAFRKGADFWNNYLIDKTYGGAYLAVNSDGSIKKGDKAVRTKTSYHSLEHSLLNYLYADLWVHEKPVTMHFLIRNSQEGEKLYPLPIEDHNVTVRHVRIDGKAYNNYDAEKQFILLPEGSNLSVEVVLSKSTE